jgi:hypothetical protein
MLALVWSFIITQHGTAIDTEGRFLRDQEATNSQDPLQFSLSNYTVKPPSPQPPPPRHGYCRETHCVTVVGQYLILTFNYAYLSISVISRFHSISGRLKTDQWTKNYFSPQLLILLEGEGGFFLSSLFNDRGSTHITRRLFSDHFPFHLQGITSLIYK